MLIHKSHSKTDLIDLINDLNLPIVHSHQDNKSDIHRKFKECLKKTLKIKDNFYNIKNIENLILKYQLLIIKNVKNKLKNINVIMIYLEENLL